MPYVSRNEAGRIVAILDAQKDPNDQWMSVDDPELMEFLNIQPGIGHALMALSNSDKEMIRVIEDVIDLLIEKNVFMYTELPPRVQQKLGERKKIRQEAGGLSNLVNTDDTIF